MTCLISLPTDPRTIPGVVSVTADGPRMVVMFSNRKTATVELSPMSPFSDIEKFDVYFPANPGARFSTAISPGKTSAEVIELLNSLAAEAARQ
jgi:hypothetical protein